MTGISSARAGERELPLWPRLQAAIFAGVTMQFICFLVALVVRSLSAAEADFPLSINEGNAALHNWSLGLSAVLSLWVAGQVFHSATGTLRHARPPRITFRHDYWPMMGPSVAVFIIVGGGINVMARGVPVLSPFFIVG